MRVLAPFKSERSLPLFCPHRNANDDFAQRSFCKRLILNALSKSFGSSEAPTSCDRVDLDKAGALLIAGDVGNTVWRVTAAGQ